MGILDILAAANVVYNAEFVPQSKSRNAGSETRSLNWRVTLAKSGVAFTTDYMQGIGHAPKLPKGIRATSMYGDEMLARTCETGCAPVESTWIKGRPLAPPTAADVLQCLLLDAEVLNFTGFEDWARDSGYDPDSRAAETVYRDCMAIALKMRHMFGDATLAALRDATADL